MEIGKYLCYRLLSLLKNWYTEKVREGKNSLFSRKKNGFQIEGLLSVFFQSI